MEPPVAVLELVADQGYHDNHFLAQCAAWQVRTYIPERKQKSRRWTDKPGAYEVAFRANRCRVRRAKGRQRNRWRSERCERTFAHVCETGGRSPDLAARTDQRDQGPRPQMRRL